MIKLDTMTRYCLFLTSMCLALMSCSSNKAVASQHASQDKIETMEDGAYCYSLDNDGTVEYVHFEITDGTIRGELLTHDEYFGDIFFPVSGNIANANTLEVAIHHDPESAPKKEQWKLSGDTLTINSNLRESEDSLFTSVDCSNLPDLSAYASPEDIMREAQAEMTENAPRSCFHKYYPEGNSRVTQSEYISVRFLPQGIEGLAAGYMEGDGNWRMSFSGTPLNDSTYLVTAKYTDEAGKIYPTSEQWVVTQESEHLTVLKILPDSYRKPGNPFHKIDCATIDDWALQLMHSED